MESYGAKVRRIRGSREKEEFAASVGITVQALSAYESGSRLPRDEVRRRIQGQLSHPNFFTQEEHNKCI